MGWVGALDLGGRESYVLNLMLGRVFVMLLGRVYIAFGLKVSERT